MKAFALVVLIGLLPSFTRAQDEKQEALAAGAGGEFNYYDEGYYRGYLDEIRACKLELPWSKMVSVIGRVKKTGSFPIASGLTASKALELAGGFTEFALDRRVGIWKNKEGKFLIVNATKWEEDPLLAEGDIVVVLQRRINF